MSAAPRIVHAWELPGAQTYTPSTGAVPASPPNPCKASPSRPQSAPSREAESSTGPRDRNRSKRNRRKPRRGSPAPVEDPAPAPRSVLDRLGPRPPQATSPSSSILDRLGPRPSPTVETGVNSTPTRRGAGNRQPALFAPASVLLPPSPSHLSEQVETLSLGREAPTVDKKLPSPPTPPRSDNTASSASPSSPEPLGNWADADDEFDYATTPVFAD
ncbi:hypothetical protein BDK51DRAFT_30147 [Blyttiomyces helicus]|uniref:Uncharacterized protein n=1 Tax=Blyttiomyces helicus TaxID=388810 RepID=A0A4P9WIU2_9FUNG|nr:hypothetical protein BDK51DRAFT_30147 [Blyttiomyces helicus]|eukprot:RKO92724.1 hypothetical protein BDK51DRAFT_30147 [Blyttiomyces helicus]